MLTSLLKPVCPRCRTALDFRTQERVTHYECSKCHGFAVHVGALKKIVSPSSFSNFVRAASTLAKNPDVQCPMCRREMRTSREGFGRKHVAIDRCFDCHLIWLDAGEWQDLEQIETMRQRLRHPSSTDILKSLGEVIIGMEEERERSAKMRTPEFVSPPTYAKSVLAIIGFPVEEDAVDIRGRTYVTKLLVLLSVVFSFVAWKNSGSAWRSLVYAADAPFFSQCTTILTYFFVHGNPGLLIGNMYFLWLFGDDIEDYLGKRRFLALWAGATSFAAIFYALFSSSNLYLAGSSACVFAFIAFYIVMFPHRRFIVFRFGYWIALPGWLFAAIYIGLQQFLLFIVQISGTSRISNLANLGGAIAGLMAAFYIKHCERTKIPIS